MFVISAKARDGWASHRGFPTSCNGLQNLQRRVEGRGRAREDGEKADEGAAEGEVQHRIHVATSSGAECGIVGEGGRVVCLALHIRYQLPRCLRVRARAALSQALERSWWIVTTFRNPAKKTDFHISCKIYNQKLRQNIVALARVVPEAQKRLSLANLSIAGFVISSGTTSALQMQLPIKQRTIGSSFWYNVNKASMAWILFLCGFLINLRTGKTV